MDEKDLECIIRKEEEQRARARLCISSLDETNLPAPPRLLLREMSGVVKFVFGAALGVFLGVMSLFITFFIFVYTMHMEF